MNVNELMYDLEVESVEDLDDRLLLVECINDFYGSCLYGCMI